ncbi:c-type cytochrome [Antarcticimicrobium luteum]|uniref:Cytochrome C n=1 Tax=Antarcticimicrobium luteum TaxID=2547397 RepID=A0A4V3ASL8_9RHOB|nr:cytochrome C [Antarcticimicrobium luteum]TDK51064.1 cytochrome C [Antarcticimicrobium luteum]
MNRLIATAIVGLLASPALAEGDVAKGEKTFGKCKACHSIVSDAGETIVKGGKTGPNLFGVVGRTAGTYEDFRYGDDIVAAGEAGLVWDEETFDEYVKDPRKFLQEHLGDKGAKSKMTFKLKKGGDDVFAYLASLAPAPATEGETEEKSGD